MEDMVNEAVAKKPAGGARLHQGGGNGALIVLGVLAGLLAAALAGSVAL